MFKFGFADPAAPSPAPNSLEEQTGPCGAPSELEHAEEVMASEGVPTGSQETVLVAADLALIKGVVSNAQAATLLLDERVASNDLIAGVYEGGFKTWEGGQDLAQLLAMQLQHQQLEQEQQQEGEQEQQQQQQQQQDEGGEQQQQGQLALGPSTRVMELGCGSGLPGLVALWAGAEVHFQDYNRSVLTTLTMQNVGANCSAWATRRHAAGSAGSAGAAGTAGTAGAAASSSGSAAAANASDAAARARYFAGSWDALPALLAELGLEHSYDLVLTAETIYSLEAMRSLYAAIKGCLRPGSGTAYVAAKSYYFGVGGGTAAFERLVEQDGCYECQHVAVIDDGKSNKREILRLTPRPAAARQEVAAAVAMATEEQRQQQQQQ